MKPKILNLIDFEKVDTLLEGFNKSTGFVTAILDLDGNVLSKSGWRQICTEFHRVHPETSKKCTISDTVLANKMKAGEKYHFYQCLNGLVDVAVPIVIKGEHIANLFSGQFFFEEPDSDFFKKQAEKYGFNPENYLKAMGKVPVVSKEKVLAIMDFLLNMTQMISDITFQKLEQMELNEAIRNKERILRLFVEHSPASIAMFDNDMKYIVASKRFNLDYNLGDQNLIGRSHYEVFPDISDSWKEIHRRCLAGETIKADEDLFSRADGTSEWVKWEIRPWYEVDEKIGGIILFSEVITKRKQTEEALQINEERLRSVFTAMSEGFSIQDVICDESGNPCDLRFVDANPAFERQTGLKNEDTLGHTLLELFPTSEHYWIERYGNVGLTGVPISFDAMFGPLNIYYHVNAFQTKPGQFGTMFTDINERKRAEEEIKSLSNIVSNSLNEIYVFDAESLKFSYANNGALKNTGFSFDEILTLTPLDIKPDFTLDTFLNTVNPLLTGEKEIINFETVHQRKNGTTYPVDVHLQLSNFERKKMFVAIILDITERKQSEQALKRSEQEFRTLTESMPQIVWATRPDGWNIYFNQQWVDYTGMTLEESYGHGWNKPFHPDDQQHAWDAWQNATQNNGIYSIEARLRRFDGEYCWWLVRGVPLVDEKGEILKWFGTCTNIDDIKKAEADLHTSEAKFRAVAELSPMAIYSSTGSDQKAVYINEAFYKIFGFTREDVPTVGHWWIKAFPDEKYRQWVMDQWTYNIEQSEKNNTAVEALECLCTCKDGSEKDIVWVGKNIGDEFWAFGYDLTDRKEAEKALHESEELLRLSSELANVAAWEMDLVADSMTRSSNHDRLYGLTDVGQWHVNTFMDATHPDDREKCNYFINGSLAPGGPDQYNFDFRILYPDRSIHWLNVIGVVIERDKNGVGTKIRGFINDITERKRAEEALLESERRFRDTLENIHLISAQINFNGEVIYCNPYLCELTGYTREEIVGNDWFSKFVPDVRPDVKEMFLKAMQSGEIETLYENPIRMKDGTERIIRFSNTVLLDPEGNVIGTTCIGEDITDRKVAEAEIKTLNQTLERRVIERTAQFEAANKELEAFSYSVSHDLRAPLRHINGYINLLNERFRDELPEKALYYLETVTNAATQMGMLIDDLLQFSRTGRQEVHQTITDMNVLVKEAIEKIKPDIENREITWSIQELPEVFGDYSLLKQVWLNLLDNAVKYTRNEKLAKISIGCTENQKEFVFFVRDNGVGFDMKYAHKLFGVFQRLHSQTEFEGTGIGLANVQRIIFKHSGRVWAEAKPNVGATFFFSLPKNKEV